MSAVIAALNNEVTRLTGKKPSEAVNAKSVTQKPSTSYSRPVGSKETKLPDGVGVRYLYQPGELEGGRRRATDPVWSLGVYHVDHSMEQEGTPIIYFLRDGPRRSFVREELLVIPADTQLPPYGVLKH